MIRNSNITQKIISMLFKDEKKPYLIMIQNNCVKAKYEGKDDITIWFSHDFGVTDLKVITKKFLVCPNPNIWSDFESNEYFDQIYALAQALYDYYEVNGQYRIKTDHGFEYRDNYYCLKKIGYNGDYYNKKANW